jgi:hypothetical protein
VNVLKLDCDQPQDDKRARIEFRCGQGATFAPFRRKTDATPRNPGFVYFRARLLFQEPSRFFGGGLAWREAKPSGFRVETNRLERHGASPRKTRAAREWAGLIFRKEWWTRQGLNL